MQKRGFQPTFLLFEGTSLRKVLPTLHAVLLRCAPSFTQERSQFYLGAHLVLLRSAPSFYQVRSQFYLGALLISLCLPPIFLSLPQILLCLPLVFLSLPQIFISLPQILLCLPQILLCLPQIFISLPQILICLPQNSCSIHVQFMFNSCSIRVLKCRVQCRVCVGFSPQTLHSATRGESAIYKENVGFCVGFAEIFVRHVLCIQILRRQQVTDNGRKTTNNGPLPFSSLISQKTE